MSETRKLPPILVCGVVGCRRLAGAARSARRIALMGFRSDLIDPIISMHHGRIV
jgi:adenylate cyclase